MEHAETHQQHREQIMTQQRGLIYCQRTGLHGHWKIDKVDKCSRGLPRLVAVTVVEALLPAPVTVVGLPAGELVVAVLLLIRPATA
jgi:hypothetical protein